MRLMVREEHGEAEEATGPLPPEGQIVAHLRAAAPVRGRLLLALATGGHALEWSRRAACLYVVEPDARGLAAFQRRLCGCLCPNVRVLGSLPARLPLPAGLVDLVYARLDLVLESQDPAAIIREAMRVLKPGGSFFAVDRALATEAVSAGSGPTPALREKLAEARAHLCSFHGFQKLITTAEAPPPIVSDWDALIRAGQFRVVVGPAEPVPLAVAVVLYHWRKPASWRQEV